MEVNPFGCLRCAHILVWMAPSIGRGVGSTAVYGTPRTHACIVSKITRRVLTDEGCERAKNGLQAWIRGWSHYSRAISWGYPTSANYPTSLQHFPYYCPLLLYSPLIYERLDRLDSWRKSARAWVFSTPTCTLRLEEATVEVGGQPDLPVAPSSNLGASSRRRRASGRPDARSPRGA